jgi:hypothetical protein
MTVERALRLMAGAVVLLPNPLECFGRRTIALALKGRRRAEPSGCNGVSRHRKVSLAARVCEALPGPSTLAHDRSDPKSPCGRILDQRGPTIGAILSVQHGRLDVPFERKISNAQ